MSHLLRRHDRYGQPVASPLVDGQTLTACGLVLLLDDDRIELVASDSTCTICELRALGIPQTTAIGAATARAVTE